MADFPVYMGNKNESNYLYHSQTNTQLTENFSNNGVCIPANTTPAITNLSGMMKDGTMWYDSDTGQIKYRSNGVVKALADV